MKPFSAIYYFLQNKTKVIICIFMITITAGLFVLGNYVASCEASYEKQYEYADKLVTVSATSADVDFKDYFEFVEEIKKNQTLSYVERSSWGFPGLRRKVPLGLEMGGGSYVFNSKEDMQKVFAHLGIECDYTNIKNKSIVMSKDMANNLNIKLGDVLDAGFDDSFDDTYTVDALIDDGSYLLFYVFEHNDALLRMYIYSDSLQGEALYNYVNELVGGRNILVEDNGKIMWADQFNAFYLVFYAIVILIAIIMAITVNAVLTGQYLKRTYEFGVYRALGISKKEVVKKCASEILLLDAIAITIGMVLELLFTYIINELVYHKQGMHLLYFSKIALLGYLLCNVLIIVPVIISKSRLCCRADVTEF